MAGKQRAIVAALQSERASTCWEVKRVREPLTVSRSLAILSNKISPQHTQNTSSNIHSINHYHHLQDNMTTLNRPPLFLMPSIMGVRSRRHLVVIRRAEAHVQAIHELIMAAVDTGVTYLNEEDEEKFRSKVMLIDHAVMELRRYLRRHPGSSIAARVTMVETELSSFEVYLEKQEQAKAR